MFYRKRCSKCGEWRNVESMAIRRCSDCGYLLRWKSHHSKYAVEKQREVYWRQKLEFQEYEKENANAGLITTYVTE